MIEYEIAALTEDFKQMRTHIEEYTKLQFQLIGVAYAIAGAALALWGGLTSGPKSLSLLVFPPVFCGLALAQLYLHSSIKLASRYINFNIRPRMETIISLENDYEGYGTVWGWEEYYVHSNRVTALLGSVIIFLAWLPAIGALLLYWLLIPTPWSTPERVLFIFDLVLVFLTFASILVVTLVNERLWKGEENRDTETTSRE